jgi:hypothetical protein
VTTDLIVIVPTRSRPQNVSHVMESWIQTGAFRDGAELHFVIDGDDPTFPDYESELHRARSAAPNGDRAVTWAVHGTWRPLVPKLNAAAEELLLWSPGAIGFAGDDHRPRTRGWVREYVSALREPGAGIVHSDDGHQGANLPTEWAMRTDIVRALGRMIPAPVEHLYCDNSVRDLGNALTMLRYLPHVCIEHMHPVAGKADSDAQYDRVNSREQYRSDRPAYRKWRDHGGLASDVATVRTVLEGEKRT